MAKKKQPKPKADDNTVDLAEVRAEIEAIRREALDLGYTLTGEKLGELREEIALVRAEREGKPPCYRRMYDQSVPHCRVCDLVHDCAAEDVPAYVPPDELRPEPCNACGTGALTVELVDQASDNVRDYGCSTGGCTNTLLQQDGEKMAEPEPEPEPELPDVKTVQPRKPVRKRSPRGKALEKRIIEVVRRLDTSKRTHIYKAIGGSSVPIKFVLDALLERGAVIQNSKTKRFEVPDADA
jgi:hypothetical protein